MREREREREREKEKERERKRKKDRDREREREREILGISLCHSRSSGLSKLYNSMVTPFNRSQAVSGAVNMSRTRHQEFKIKIIRMSVWFGLIYLHVTGTV